MNAIDVIGYLHKDLNDYCDTYVIDLLLNKGKRLDNRDFIIQLENRIGCNVVRFEWNNHTYTITDISMAEDAKEVILHCNLYDNDTNLDYKDKINFCKLNVDTKVKILKMFYMIYRKTLKMD